MMNFADRYAEAGIAPGADIIARRQSALETVPKDLGVAQILGLCRFYFDLPNADVEWLVEILRTEDASYSMIANRQETVVLAACVLADRIENKSSLDLLGVVVTSAMGLRKAKTSPWLIDLARQALIDRSVEARKTPGPVIISKPATSKLADEIKAAGDDFEAQKANMVKLRSEALSWSSTLASQSAAAATQLFDQLNLLKEETNILWWLFGETSDLLNEPFAALGVGTADIVAGFDMAHLTTSDVGPVAAPAMMARMVRLAKKSRAKLTLTMAIEGLTTEQVERVNLNRSEGFDDVFLMHSAMELFANNGAGSWQQGFMKRSGFDPEQALEGASLRLHAYYEYLLALQSLR